MLLSFDEYVSLCNIAKNEQLTVLKMYDWRKSVILSSITISFSVDMLVY